MTPEERACLVDLMIYQHQKGVIPNDIERLSLYCTGIAKAALKATLEAKFKLTDKGWLNPTLNKIISHRENYTETQSKNGKIGQILKKLKAFLPPLKFKDFVNEFNKLSQNEKFEILSEIEISEKGNIEAMLQAMLKHIINRNRNTIINKNELLYSLNDNESTNGIIDEIVDFFHEKCKSLPRVVKITKQRRSLVLARIREHSIDDVKKVIEITSQSNFLTGNNDKGWTADFDFIFTASKFVKILEGQYSNKKPRINSRIDSLLQTEKHIQNGTY